MAEGMKTVIKGGLNAIKTGVSIARKVVDNPVTENIGHLIPPLGAVTGAVDGATYMIDKGIRAGESALEAAEKVERRGKQIYDTIKTLKDTGKRLAFGSELGRTAKRIVENGGRRAPPRIGNPGSHNKSNSNVNLDPKYWQDHPDTLYRSYYTTDWAADLKNNWETLASLRELMGRLTCEQSRLERILQMTPVGHVFVSPDLIKECTARGVNPNGYSMHTKVPMFNTGALPPAGATMRTWNFDRTLNELSLRKAIKDIEKRVEDVIEKYDACKKRAKVAKRVISWQKLINLSEGERERLKRTSKKGDKIYYDWKAQGWVIRGRAINPRLFGAGI